jgi:hypothetical protein
VHLLLQSGRGMKFAGGASRSERAQTTGLQSSQLQQSQISSVTPSGQLTPSRPDCKQQQPQLQQQELKPPVPAPKSPVREDVVLKPGDLVQAMPKKTPPPVLPRQRTVDKERAPPPPPSAPEEAEDAPMFNHHALSCKESLEGHEDLPCCRATMDLFPGMSKDSTNL